MLNYLNDSALNQDHKKKVSTICRFSRTLSSAISRVSCQHKIGKIELWLLYYISDFLTLSINENRIGGVMIIVFASNAVDRVFEPRSGKTKN